MRFLFSLVLILTFVTACAERTKPNESDLANIFSTKVDKVLVNRVYDVAPSQKGKSRLENVVLFQGTQGISFAILRRSSEGWAPILHRPIPENCSLRKLLFIRSSEKYSHSVLLCESQQRGKFLWLIDFKGNSQMILTDSWKGVAIEKIDSSGSSAEELLKVQKLRYRFNGIVWMPWYSDLPFPYFEEFRYSPDESWLVFRNIGAYTSRFVLTLSFPELTAANFKGALRLTKNIPTVKLYAPGSSVHHRRNRRTRILHPMIEVVKEPFGSTQRIRLPFFIRDANTKMRIRGVYAYRGAIELWPTPDFNSSEPDQQGYPAFVYNGRSSQ